jgi:hypothetical protein
MPSKDVPTLGRRRNKPGRPTATERIVPSDNEDDDCHDSIILYTRSPSLHRKKAEPQQCESGDVQLEQRMELQGRVSRNALFSFTLNSYVLTYPLCYLTLCKQYSLIAVLVILQYSASSSPSSRITPSGPIRRDIWYSIPTAHRTAMSATGTGDFVAVNHQGIVV